MAKTQSRTRKARRRRQQQRRQSQRLYLLIAIVVVAVVAIAVVFVSNQPVEAHIPDELSARYEGIERSFSPEGYPRLGISDAPVNVAEYASFACPGCETFHESSFDAVLERVRSGQARFTYVPLQTGSVPNAAGASRAALCAGEQGKFWEMHDVLFDWQTRYGNTAFSQNRLLAGKSALELNSDAFTSCFNSAATNDTLNAALNEEVTTTPTIRVNGVTLESGQTIPSSAAILQAIDDATPADWGVPAEPEPGEEAGEVEAAVEAATDVEDEPPPTEAASDAPSAPDAETSDTQPEAIEEPTYAPAETAAAPTPEDTPVVADQSEQATEAPNE